MRGLCVLGWEWVSSIKYITWLCGMVEPAQVKCVTMMCDGCAALLQLQHLQLKTQMWYAQAVYWLLQVLQGCHHHNMGWHATCPIPVRAVCQLVMMKCSGWSGLCRNRLALNARAACAPRLPNFPAVARSSQWAVSSSGVCAKHSCLARGCMVASFGCLRKICLPYRWVYLLWMHDAGVWSFLVAPFPPCAASTGSAV